MSDWLREFGNVLLETLRAVTPIVMMLVLFQVLVIRKPLPNPRRILVGFVYVLLGVALFLEGLKMALFPVGDLMAKQLTAPEFLGAAHHAGSVHWHTYIWVYLFAGSIGFATTLAEPALIAVALKAAEVSAGAINPWGLRLAVACGAAFGLALGTFRIVTGTDLYLYIVTGYVVVVIQTALAPRMIVGLAYDSGGVTTSTVTVPIVTALGLGLASAVPGRNPLADGFGLIAFTCLFPIISVLGYAQIAAWQTRRNRQTDNHD
ncbi:DUF1538 domain-containing protein [Methylocaldum sp.]|uniref:DUF1538 domain-containing protein n=1 Tax=Methylocaldum sp. TaxID=1969727 RepID=UPI002D3019DA|nr:DUF1538 domain-containing protein [Methylocaldum sp.]HYE34112.1 DUF1538 domain-containing protein [Methylocaldum sp.]